jgi:hypothetical protein
MSTNPKNVKRLLEDIAKELDVTGNITDTFSVLGHSWTFSLLNEEESNWRMAHVVMSNQLSAVASFRLPTLSIGIRKIDDISVYEYFDEEWQALPADKRSELMNMNTYSRKYFCAEHLMKFLADRYPEGIAELWEKYQTLEARRTEAIVTLKKSSGESSEQETKEENTTEPSPTGAE